MKQKVCTALFIAMAILPACKGGTVNISDSPDAADAMVDSRGDVDLLDARTLDRAPDEPVPPQDLQTGDGARLFDAAPELMDDLVPDDAADLVEIELTDANPDSAADSEVGPEIAQPDMETWPDVSELGTDLVEDLPAETMEDLPPLPECGDKNCEPDENCKDCPQDCGKCPPVCGDGECDLGGNESPWNCPEDCGSCGDGVCGAGEEDICPQDCAPFCGNGKCDGLESGNPDSPVYCATDCGECGDGVCGFLDFVLGCQEIDCDPACGDGECTDDETPFSCPADCGPPCGDGLCEQGETPAGCPVDCGNCGDGICGKTGGVFENCPEDCVAPCGDGKCSWGESGQNCPQDCGGCGDSVCSFAELESKACPADCEGCGDGTCQPEETDLSCAADCAVCAPLCLPAWECGDAGCGEQCGGCPEGKVCHDHTCCIPDCGGKQCGDDGCGGTCGGCEAYQQCAGGWCVCSDDDGAEDNDLCTAAEPLEPGTYEGLSICPADDDDWYSFWLPAGKTVKASIVFENAFGDLDLRLYEQGNCVGPVAVSTVPGDLEQITYTSVSTGTHLLLVSGGGPFPGNTYDLTVSIGNPECGDKECNGDENCETCGEDCGFCCLDCEPFEVCTEGECICQDDAGFEPNDVCLSPVPIEPGIVHGLAICNNGDEDWYLVQAKAGDTLIVEALFENTDGNLSLYLYPQGNCVGHVAKSSTFTDNEKIEYESPVTSSYYVLVEAYGPAVGNVYDLKIALSPPSCGDQACGENENCLSCPADCPCGCGEECLQQQCQFTACEGKQCGADGCGGICAVCPGPQDMCINATCICQPDCDGKNCGPDGCGGTCGECEDQHECQQGVCTCIALNCDAYPDGCGLYDTGCGGKIACKDGCPLPDLVDLFLVIGGSNARGRGNGPASLTVEPDTAYEYDPNSDFLFPLQFPTGLPAGNYWTSDQTSFVVAFGRTWWEQTGRKAVFVCRAKGGSALVESADFGQGDWTDDKDSDGLVGTAMAAYLAALNHLENDPTVVITAKYVLWHQGEADGDHAVLPMTYRNALAVLLSTLGEQGGFDAYFISEIGYRLPYSAGVTAQYLQVIKGQQQVQSVLENAVLASQLPRALTLDCLGDVIQPGCALWDNYHYETWAYEQLGIDMAANAAGYVATGIKPLKPDL